MLRTGRQERVLADGEVLPVCRPHHDGVGHGQALAQALAARRLPEGTLAAALRRAQSVVGVSPGHALGIARRKAEIQAGVAEIRLDVVRVHVEPAALAVDADLNGLRPGLEVLRGDDLDRADPLRRARLGLKMAVARTVGEIHLSAQVHAVLIADRIPEDDVERVEGEVVRRLPAAHHQPFAPEADAVRRREIEEPPLGLALRIAGIGRAVEGDALVALGRRAAGIRILHHHEVVPVVLRPVEDDVVLLRPVELPETELGPRPREAVAALGIADLEARPAEPGALNAPGRALIVHAVEDTVLVLVLEDVVVAAEVSLPRLVVHHHRAGELRPVLAALGGRRRGIDRRRVAQHLQAVADRNRILAPQGKRRAERGKNRHEKPVTHGAAHPFRVFSGRRCA